MISPLMFSSMLVDWTDPQQAMYVLFSSRVSCLLKDVCSDVPGRELDDTIHLDLATLVIKEILKSDPFGPDKTTLESK
jgi:hypothetical protein